MTSAPRTSQLSGSTAYNPSLESLGSSATIMVPTNGQVIATSNIINQKADASRSLYQICVALKQRLGQVPGFEGYMQELEQRSMDPSAGPVEALWGLLRTGRPLLAIYNALQPARPLSVAHEEQQGVAEEKIAKIAIMRFVGGTELNLPTSVRFIIADLTGHDTTGFVKVTSAINYVLDLLESRGLLNQAARYPEDDIVQQGSQMSYRDFIVKELVDTERKYVQDLENLHDLRRTLEQNEYIPGDMVHAIFLNINAILDFQRRFLIRVETTNSMPQERQEWGTPFVACENSFVELYQPFIANQRKAAQLAQQSFDKIVAANHPVACDYNTLDGFLLKPMQRLVKYPLLLNDLAKKTEDESIKADLIAGKAAAERVLSKANEAVNRDLLDEALDELVHRVDDWKNHRVEQFGKLLLHGVYTVVTGKSDQAKDYEIYLFECILLCCKELTANKSKDKKDKTKSTGPKVRNRHAKLQLKGRIFMSNVTDVVAISKTGSYTVQIWWKGDPGVENFMIKFQNEEMMKKWATGLEEQRKNNAPLALQSPDQMAPPNFAWMAAQTSGMENPYAQADEDDDDEATYGMINGRNPRGPSMPVMPRDAQREAQMQQQRSRSYSTPDINGQPNNRRPANGTVPAVPGIPHHLTHERHDSNASRSNAGSPANDMPMRSNNQSPGTQRMRQQLGGNMVQFPPQPMYPGRTGTPLSNGLPGPPNLPPNGLAPLAPFDPSRNISPALGTAPLLSTPTDGGALPLPTQLKVKVNWDSNNYTTLVVNYNITYQTLIDRIENKLAKFTSKSIARGDLKLRYKDDDNDFVTIEGDDDIQIAISEWREGLRSQHATPGTVGEIELFCVGDIK
ncbi:hypothetical protein P8C59_004458 [Phyllachora maydis]|uniref:Uncharacterized protein n=1 Tax=Phyllachora maydis TaxID=1825666 RepID=A0AAD9MBB3_9PEZI|nr:hypothetical protein P8C59_004458 [Phyllachora maydis]